MSSIPSTVPALTACTLGLMLAPGAVAQQPAAPEGAPPAHFHHLHLNATDPAAAIGFYTTKFDAEKARFAGLMDAVWAQKSWILFTPVKTPPVHEITSAIWHFGWGAEDMKAAYQKQLDSGTSFQTPITDISDISGNTGARGLFFYAYVDGPDHSLVEINTASHHHFGHLHLLSEDPIAAGEWYIRHFGAVRRANRPPSREPRMYRGVQIGPSMSLMMDNVNIIIYPVEYARTSGWKAWEGRETFESTRGHVVDHVGFSVDNLEEAIQRLRKDGVTITQEPRSIAQGKIRFAFIEGPDKMAIEVIEGHPRKE